MVHCVTVGVDVVLEDELLILFIEFFTNNVMDVRICNLHTTLRVWTLYWKFPFCYLYKMIFYVHPE
jgi:hypothetical protein